MHCLAPFLSCFSKVTFFNNTESIDKYFLHQNNISIIYDSSKFDLVPNAFILKSTTEYLATTERFDGSHLE